MALALREQRHEVFFLYVRQVADCDVDQMRSFWGERFWAVPYKNPLSVAGWKRRVKTKLDLHRGRLLKSQDIQQRALYTFGIDDWYDGELDTNIVSLCKIPFDVVLVEYVFFSKALNNFGSNVFKVIDTLDVFSNRHQLFLQNNLKPTWFSTTPAQEALGLSRADAVIAINADDADRLEGITNRPITTVGHIVPLVEPTFANDPSQNILFVGSNNPINVHSIHNFMQDIWPRVRAQNENARLIIAGDVCDYLDPCDGVVCLGRVQELSQVYAMARLAINPVFIGTGISIKTVEALGYSKPVITTPIGARGLSVQSCPAIRIAESSQGFVDQILDLLVRDELMRDLSNVAFAFASEWNQLQRQSLLNLFGQDFEAFKRRNLKN